MSTITSAAPITPEDLLAMPDSVNYELVNGKLVERNMGMISSRIGMQIGYLLKDFLKSRPVGQVFGSDAGYQCFPDDPRKVRKPDVSFITLERLPLEKTPSGHCRIAPDLAVEVVSPNDFYHEVEEKIEEYLSAGVPLIWIVDPVTRTVRIHRQRSSQRGKVQDLQETDTISGEDVLPGFAHRE